MCHGTTFLPTAITGTDSETVGPVINTGGKVLFRTFYHTVKAPQQDLARSSSTCIRLEGMQAAAAQRSALIKTTLRG
jgi:hypothetical protein